MAWPSTVRRQREAGARQRQALRLAAQRSTETPAAPFVDYAATLAEQARRFNAERLARHAAMLDRIRAERAEKNPDPMLRRDRSGR